MLRSFLTEMPTSFSIIQTEYEENIAWFKEPCTVFASVLHREIFTQGLIAVRQHAQIIRFLAAGQPIVDQIVFADIG